MNPSHTIITFFNGKKKQLYFPPNKMFAEEFVISLQLQKAGLGENLSVASACDYCTDPGVLSVSQCEEEPPH